MWEAEIEMHLPLVLQIPTGVDAGVAQLVKFRPSAQVIIAGCWDEPRIRLPAQWGAYMRARAL